MLPVGAAGGLPWLSNVIGARLAHRWVISLAPGVQVVDGLSPAERDLLSTRLASLAQALEPGLGRLNWISRGIDDFVAKAGAAVHDFQGLVNQVRRCGPRKPLARHAHGLPQSMFALHPAPRAAGPQISKSAAALEKAVSAIASADLVADAQQAGGGEVPELQEFYQRMEKARAAAAEAAVSKYRSMTPVLCKVREHVWRRQCPFCGRLEVKAAVMPAN